MQLLDHLCDSLSNTEAYATELQVARYAYGRTPAGDYYYLSLFSYYIGTVHQGVNSDSAISYLERSLDYARKGNHQKQVVSALNRLLYLYNNVAGKVKQRDATAATLLHITDTTSSEELKTALYQSLGNYYAVLGDREQQMHYLLADLEMSRKQLQVRKFTANDSSNLGVAYINIGENYLVMDQPLKALEYIRSAKVFLRNYKSGLAHYYKDLSTAYLQLNKVPDAIQYHDSLTQMLIREYDIPDGWDIRMAIDLSFADYYLDRNRPDSALQWMNRAGALAGKKVTDAFLLAQFKYMMGCTLAANKNYPAALPYLEAAERAGREMGLEVYANILRGLAQCHAGLKQWELASGYYARYLPIRDSLYTTASQTSLAEAEAKYQNRDKQRQLDNKEQQLGFIRRQQLWLIGGLLLAGLVAGLLVVIYRNKKMTADVLASNNELLAQLNRELQEANTTKAKLFSIIGHDLRSPISQVYQFLKLQQQNPGRLNGQQQQELNHKIQTATGSLLETMEDLLLWSKTQLNQFHTRLQPVALQEITDQCIRLMKLNADAKQVRIVNHIPGNATAHTDPDYLQAIIRNLLQNAIKASPAGAEIAIDFHENHILSMTNQGARFTRQDFETALLTSDHFNLSGLGLKLVDELCRKIGAVITFSDEVATGTKAILKLTAV